MSDAEVDVLKHKQTHHEVFCLSHMKNDPKYYEQLLVAPDKTQTH